MAKAKKAGQRARSANCPGPCLTVRGVATFPPGAAPLGSCPAIVKITYIVAAAVSWKKNGTGERDRRCGKVRGLKAVCPIGNRVGNEARAPSAKNFAPLSPALAGV